ncbi:MAG: PRC-barrel domain-containing protein, partial [Saccharothrix sp.]|nr:PRC-barrel domain-containing protein [Saccharothrix sp.]
MINQAEVDRLYDCEVIDEHGERIGSVKQVWLDDRDGQPMWASVHTGLFGLKESFVPIQDATLGNGVVTVHVDKQKVKDAPRIDVSDQHMSDKQQDELYEYYGMIPMHRTGDHDRLEGRGRGQGGAETKPMPAAGQASGRPPLQGRGETGRPTSPAHTTAGQPV